MAQGSTSKINKWRRCLKKGYYGDILKLERNTPSIAPRRGTILHECLQNLYKGKDWTEPINKLTVDLANVFEEERAEWAELPQELYRLMKSYINAYRALDGKLTTLATEVKFEMPLGKHTYHGTIDWVYKDANGLWLADHKTVKSMPDTTEMYMDIQTLMYHEAIASGCVPSISSDVTGIVFNHIRTKPPRVPQPLKSGAISKAAIDTDVYTYFEAVRNAGLDPKDYEDMIDKLKDNVFFRRIRIPASAKTIGILKQEINATLNTIDQLEQVVKTHGAEATAHLFPRTMLKQRCNWDCEFSQLCFGELAGQNTEGIIADYYQTREERYDDDEI